MYELQSISSRCVNCQCDVCYKARDSLFRQTGLIKQLARHSNTDRNEFFIHHKHLLLKRSEKDESHLHVLVGLTKASLCCVCVWRGSVKSCRTDRAGLRHSCIYLTHRLLLHLRALSLQLTHLPTKQPASLIG